MHGIRFLSDPSPCPYLPGRVQLLENELVFELTEQEYADAMNQGFRRFGHNLFRPKCPRCTACRSLRIDVARFQPNRSQSRCWKKNCNEVRRELAPPQVTAATLDLFGRFHDERAENKGWERHDRNPFDHASSFVDNPISAFEWRYFLNDQLVGVGYVDDLPVGLSAIYFAHDPGYRDRSLGTFNVLSLIEEARTRGLPHVYLGYHVEGCGSLEYKAKFRPNEILTPKGEWVAYQGRDND